MAWKGSARGLGGSSDCGPTEVGRRGRVIPGPWRLPLNGPSLVEDLPGQPGEIIGVRFPPQPVLTLEERVARLEERICELEAKELARACGSRWERLVAVWRGDL